MGKLEERIEELFVRIDDFKAEDIKLYERVVELEKLTKKHKEDIFYLKGNEQAHDFMYENQGKIRELEQKLKEAVSK